MTDRSKEEAMLKEAAPILERMRNPVHTPKTRADEARIQEMIRASEMLRSYSYGIAHVTAV